MDSSRFSLHLSSLPLILLLSGPLDAGAVETYTPLDWQPKLGDKWNRDTDNNNVEDVIDLMPPGDMIDVILDLNDCPEVADLTRFGMFGTVDHVSAYLSVVVLRGVLVVDAVALGADPKVAMVEYDSIGSGSLVKGLQALKVTGSTVYSPSTIEDQFPSLDGTGINIAILDSGVDDGVHDCLPSPKFVGGCSTFPGGSSNPDDNLGHGTHVASIALGAPWTDSGSIARRGVAPGAGLVDIEVLTSANQVTKSNAIEGIDSCLARRDDWDIRVMSLSFQFCDDDNGKGSLAQAVDLAVSHGIVAAVAMGNTCNCGLGTNANMVPEPASAGDAITVGSASYEQSVDRGDDYLSRFSLKGPRADGGQKPNVTAYGDDARGGSYCVPAPDQGIRGAKFNTANGDTAIQGTSQAAPQVAGLAALILQNDPNRPPLSVRELLQNTAQDFAPGGVDDYYGYGIVDGFAAVESTAITDLYFPGAGLSVQDPNSWTSVGVRPQNAAVQESQSNALEFKVMNAGPGTARDFKVRLETYAFGLPTPLGHLFTTVSFDSLPPGDSTVVVPWVPRASGGVVCASVRGEILYGFDTNYLNNEVYHHVLIRTAASPAVFPVRVRNPTEEDIVITFEDDLQAESNWSMTVSEPVVGMGGLDCPRTVFFELTPNEGAVDTVRVNVTAQGTTMGESLLPLGGFTLVAVNGSTVGVGDRPHSARGLRALPNPFEDKAEISFSLSNREAVKVVVFGIDGRRVRGLADGILGPGAVTLTWDGRDDFGRDTSTGIYFVHLRTASREETQKVVRIR